MHYTVLVIGENPEEQLGPFNEDRSRIMELEREAYIKRKKEDPNASPDPVYLVRADKLDVRRQEWLEDVAAGKNHEATFEAYVYEYYYGEINFVPISVYESKPEIETSEHTNDFNNITRYHWSLTFGNRFAVVDERGKVSKIVYYAVPNPKWDWYVLGGRWKNFLKIKPGAVGRIAYENAQTYPDGKRFEDIVVSMFGGKPEENPRDKRVGYCDQLRKGDLDIEGARADARIEGAKYYDDFHAIVQGRPFATYDERLAEANGDHAKARELQEKDPVDRAIRQSDFLWADQDELKELRKSREQYIELWANRVFSTYSLLVNGVWEDRETWNYGNYRRGIESSVIKRDPEEWHNHINQLIESASDDTLISLYDYHC
jgi:hypothetical protein